MGVDGYGFGGNMERREVTLTVIRESIIKIIRELIISNIPYLKEEEVFSWCSMQMSNMKIKGDDLRNYGKPVQSAFRLYEIYQDLI